MFVKFPSIEQFRNAVTQMRYWHHQNRLPSNILTFEGTIKLHGTNACVCIYKDGAHHVQSRNRKLEGEDQHQGFRPFIDEKLKESDVMESFQSLAEDGPVYVFGEWMGQGIQRGVAVSQLSKRFVVFAARCQEQWIPRERLEAIQHPEHGIYNVFQFPTFQIDVDVQEPTMVQNQLVEITEQVERECPAGKFFGVEGVGEGVVWRCITPGLETSQFWFKVKGQKHTVSKVKKLAQVDVEKVRSIREFVENVATEQRMQQGIEYLREFDKELTIRSMGDFLGWVFRDVLKEEADTMEASGIAKKELGKPLSSHARNWYQSFLDRQLMGGEP